MDNGRVETGNVHECGCPFGAIDIVEFFEHDLDFLTIGSALGNEMEALSTTPISSSGTIRQSYNPTFAFFTSAGVASSNNPYPDIFAGEFFPTILRFRTLSIGVCTLRCLESCATLLVERNI